MENQLKFIFLFVSLHFYLFWEWSLEVIKYACGIIFLSAFTSLLNFNLYFSWKIKFVFVCTKLFILAMSGRILAILTGHISPTLRWFCQYCTNIGKKYFDIFPMQTNISATLKIHYNIQIIYDEPVKTEICLKWNFMVPCNFVFKGQKQHKDSHTLGRHFSWN